MRPYHPTEPDSDDMTSIAPSRPQASIRPRPGPVASCRQLVKRFGDRTAVNDLSFEIAPGETYGLLGPNGAGKTTSISILCGLVAPDEGAVHISGSPLSGHTQLKSSIGLVPQEIALYPDLTARENLDFFARLQGLDRVTRRSRIAEVLEIVGLTDRADDRVGEYSGGMQRRCNIAAGLVHEPKLLVLDEPTVGVDPQSRNQILDSIERLGGEGLAVLYTTHYMEEAERLCDRIGIMDRGTMIAEGTRRELVAQIGEHDRVRISTPATDVGELERSLQRLPQVIAVTPTPSGVEVTVNDAHRAISELVSASTQAGVSIGTLETVEPDLETVFLQLTGRALRD